MEDLVGIESIYHKTFRKKRGGRGTNFFLAMASACVLLSLHACAPVLYHADLKYEPTNEYPKLEKIKPDFTMTIALFNDMRQIDDTIRMGKVSTADGTIVPVLPRYTKVADAVTAGIREYLYKSGYEISTQSPPWDLKEDTIDKNWGRILIGGSIEDLEIVCEKSIPVKTYQSKVKLALVFADIPKKRIFYHTRVESKAALKDVFFSEKILTRQINGAYAEALEKIFDDPAIRKKIEEAAKRNENE